MFGALKSSARLLGSYLKKLPYKMSQTRKRHIRERLKNVEHTLDVLNSTGIPLKALDKANMVLRYSNLSPTERYTFFSWKTAVRKPIHLHPKYTKVEAPSRVPYGYD